MNNLELSPEQYRAYKEIELRIHLQRSIELIDDLNAIEGKSKNKSLNSQLKAIHPTLDKQTKMYNELFNVSQEGISHFYDITKKNTEYIMSYNILDKALICKYLVAHEIDGKAVEGIIHKIIKNKN